MATYYIVDKDTDPLGPDQKLAGDTIEVSEGDIFIVTATANANTKFEATTADGTNFEIRFEETNTNGFDIEVRADLTAEITVNPNIDIDGVNIMAGGSDGISMTVENGATIGTLTGSTSGADTVNVGDGVTWNGDLNLGDGDNAITIGNDNTFGSEITTGDGADTLTAGDCNTFSNTVDTGAGSDTLTFGSDNLLIDIWSGDDGDVTTVGLVDTTQSQSIDGVSHTGDDGDPTNDDTLNIWLSDADQAALEAELLANGYTLDGITWSAGPGADYHLHVNNLALNDWENIRIVCFTPGTMIATDAGPRPIETLEAGDQVLTADHGFQPIRWIGRRLVPAAGKLAPVRIEADVLGNRNALTVSPQHRLMLSDPRLELHFDTSEVLAPAKALTVTSGVSVVEGGLVDYIHLLFDDHEIIYAEGVPSETLYLPDAQAWGFTDETRAEVNAIFPQLSDAAGPHKGPARRLLKVWEAELAIRLLRHDAPADSTAA